MNRKRIPWYEPHIGKAEFENIEQVLSSHFPNQGPFTKRLEEEMCARLGVKHAVATTNGTSAIFLALKALGIGHGDEVIVPDITFIATANAVRLTGAEPVLVDVEPERLTIDLERMAAAVTSRTKAVIPVHVTGRAADMEAVLACAKERNLFVVEDAAQALCSRHRGKYLGTFGNAGCFSFSAVKLITSGQGGMVITDDEETAQKLRALKNHGIAGRGTGGDDVHPTVGFNFKYTDLQAAVAVGQLEQLDARIEQGRRRHRMYTERLGRIDGLMLYPFEPDEFPLWTDIQTERRDDLERYLNSKSIDGRRYFHPLHRQAPYLKDDSDFPNSTRLSPQSFWLPSAFTSTDEDFAEVCEEIERFFTA